jgi:ankyrin repeat protein
MLQCSKKDQQRFNDDSWMTLSGGAIHFARLEPGDYQLRLLGLPDPIQTVTLTESDPVQTNVFVHCPRQPTLNRALWCQLQFDGPYVLELLQAGADASFQPPETGYTTLMAANELTPKNARALLAAGAEVNRTNHTGQTALMFAVERWSPEVVRILLEAGAKLDVTNQEGRTPLDLAVWEGRDELAQTLRALGAPGTLAESKAQGGLRGAVRDEIGTPVAGVSVRCLLDGGELEDSGFGVSGRDGRYFIDELKLGTYHVQLGFGDETWKTVVLSNRDETVEGVDFQIPGTDGPDWRLLHFSSRRDGSVAQLLKQGADPNARDPEDGRAPLHNAASEPQPRDVQVLLATGARIDATNRWGQTALMIAARSEQLRNVELLLKAGADIHRVDHMACSALHLACENGNSAIAARLIEAGADLQQTNRWGRTPLDDAVWEGHAELAGVLRANGAPGTLTVPKPSGSLSGIAVDENGEPFRKVRFHVQRQAAGTERSGGHREAWTEADGAFALRELAAGCYRFASASRMDSPVIVGLTNDWDTQSDLRVELPRRCVQEAELHAAVADDDPKAVARLLAAGADPRSVDCENGSLLEMALNQWATNVVPVLLAHGADLDAPGADGYTPLRRAACDWSSWKIPYLLRMGAAVRPDKGGNPLLLIDVTRRDPDEDEDMQRFRLRHAARCAKTAKLLIGAGASVDVRDEEGMTPLHHAARNGYAECAEVLLKAGAELNATNSAGQTPFAMATQSQQIHTADMLRKHGAAESAPTP